MLKSQLLRAVSVCTVLITMLPAMADIKEQVAESKAYVSALPEDCLYDHGYQCIESGVDQPTDLAMRLTAKSGTIPAPVIAVWPAAYEQFLKEEFLSEEQKKLKHYRIGFRAAEQGIEVSFLPLLLPHLENGEVIGKLRATLGHEVRITINPSDSSVVNVIYGR